MNEQLVAILHKSINGAALTDTEKKELNDWIGLSHHNRNLYDEIMDSETFRQDVKKTLRYDSKILWNKITQLYPPKHKNTLISFFRRRSFWYAAAAVLIIFISTTAYILFVKPTTHTQKASETQSPVIADVSPGIEKAVLTLGNGTNLLLDKTSNGKIAEQGNTIIVKEDGLLAYNSDSRQPSKGVLYNMLTTAKAEYYSSLVLADGSKVWLNSLSSIRFPTSFTGKDRVVEVTGEVYFEVTKNAAKPFKVNVKDKVAIVVYLIVD